MWKDPRGWMVVIAVLLGASPMGRAQVAAPTPSPGEPETEEIVVSATRIETPIDEIGSSVTVITDEEIARNQQRTLPDVLQTVPGLNIVQTKRPRRKDFCLPARQQFESNESDHRWHRCERPEPGWSVRFRTGANVGLVARGSVARSTEQSLRLGRPRWSDQSRHEKGGRTAQLLGLAGRRIVRDLQSNGERERLDLALQLLVQRCTFPG